MRSYFARHTDKLLIRDEDLKKLWDDDRIAIHYPDKKSAAKKKTVVVSIQRTIRVSRGETERPLPA